VVLENVVFYTTAASVTLVSVTGPNLNPPGCGGFTMRGCLLYGGVSGLDIVAAHFCLIEHNLLWNQTGQALTIANVWNSDQTDNRIVYNIFQTGVTPSTGINLKCGGNYIAENKFLGFQAAISLDAANLNVNTGNLMVMGNSIEGFFDAGVILSRSSGTFSFEH